MRAGLPRPRRHDHLVGAAPAGGVGRRVVGDHEPGCDVRRGGPVALPSTRPAPTRSSTSCSAASRSPRRSPSACRWSPAPRGSGSGRRSSTTVARSPSEVASTTRSRSRRPCPGASSPASAGSRRHRLGAAVHRAARGGPSPARRPHRRVGRDDEHGIPAPEGDQGLRHHEGPGVPDVGLQPTRRRLRPRPRQTLAGRADHTGQPRRTLPTTPSAQATPTVDLPARTRRQRHVDLTQRQAAHDPARPRRLATTRAGQTARADFTSRYATSSRSVRHRSDHDAGGPHRCGGTHVGLPTGVPLLQRALRQAATVRTTGLRHGRVVTPMGCDARRCTRGELP